MRVVAFGAGIELGPAAIVVLCFKEITDTLDSGFLVFLNTRGVVQAGQVSDFRRSRLVIDGAFVDVIFLREGFLALLLRQFGRDEDVLRPPACGLLVEQDVVADAQGFLRPEEVVVQLRRQLGPVFIRLLVFVRLLR